MLYIFMMFQPRWVREMIHKNKKIWFTTERKQPTPKSQKWFGFKTKTQGMIFMIQRKLIES